MPGPAHSLMHQQLNSKILYCPYFVYVKTRNCSWDHFSVKLIDPTIWLRDDLSLYVTEILAIGVTKFDMAWEYHIKNNNIACLYYQRWRMMMQHKIQKGKTHKYRKSSYKISSQWTNFSIVGCLLRYLGIFFTFFIRWFVKTMLPFSHPMRGPPVLIVFCLEFAK